MKIVHKVFLLVTVPLLIELVFLYVISINLEDARESARLEAKTGKNLVYVNLVLFDAINVASSLVMYKALNDNNYLAAVMDNTKTLQTHRDQLRRSVATKGGQHDELQTFIGRLDDFAELLSRASDIYQENSYVSSVRAIGKLKSYITRVNHAGSQVIEKQIQQRQHLQESWNAASSRLQSEIRIFSVATVFVALLFGFILSITFNRRLNALVDNTRRLGTNQPLLENLSGTDELALLDKVMHQMSAELSSARQKERALIDNTAEIILSLDENLTVTQVNPAVKKILGFEVDELIGKDLKALFLLNELPAVMQSFANCKSSRGETSFENQLRRSDSQLMYASWTVRWSNDLKSYFCITHDISERKEAEKLKQEVMAIVSHDLRSPLCSLEVSLEVLADTEGLAQLTPEGAKLLSNAQASVGALIAMINDLLEVERFERDGLPLDLRLCSISTIAKEACDMLAASALEKKIEIDLDCGNWELNVDRERIRRVLINLLSNAIKFSPAVSPGKIQVTAKETQKNDTSMLEISVRDHGPGIEPGKEEIIFEKFRQAGRRDEGEQSGSGLGLAICKAIVEAHDGKIGVASDAAGSRFWFLLKLP